MASVSFVLLSLALFAIAIAAPVDQAETTTAGVEEVPVVEYLQVIETIPVVQLVPVPATVAAKEGEHKVVKRSALRGDNPSNDLLADFEGLRIDTGVSSLDGRRIKFLPTWLG